MGVGLTEETLNRIVHQAAREDVPTQNRFIGRSTISRDVVRLRQRQRSSAQQRECLEDKGFDSNRNPSPVSPLP